MSVFKELRRLRWAASRGESRKIPLNRLGAGPGPMDGAATWVRRMAYAVKEIFYTLQGEGRNAGRAAVFCRFTGCNLWSGREEDRATAACRFCDTDFIGLDGPGGGPLRDA